MIALRAGRAKSLTVTHQYVKVKDLTPAPSVVLALADVEMDVKFLEMILHQEEKTNAAMPIDSLILLSRLRNERRLTATDLTQDIQKPVQATRAVLEKLVEAGLVEAHGTGRGRAYTLSARLYCQTGQKAAYVQQAGFDPIQQEQMVLSFIDKHGSIRRADVVELCHLNPPQAYRLLKRLNERGLIRKTEEKSYAV